MWLETLFWHLACNFGYREGHHGWDTHGSMQTRTVLPKTGQVNHTCLFLSLSLKKPFGRYIRHICLKVLKPTLLLVTSDMLALLTDPRTWCSWFLNHCKCTGSMGPSTSNYSVIWYTVTFGSKRRSYELFPLQDRRGEIYLHFFLPGKYLRH